MSNIRKTNHAKVARIVREKQTPKQDKSLLRIIGQDRRQSSKIDQHKGQGKPNNVLILMNNDYLHNCRDEMSCQSTRWRCMLVLIIKQIGMTYIYEGRSNNKRIQAPSSLPSKGTSSHGLLF
jgi:hypothetical protein